MEVVSNPDAETLFDHGFITPWRPSPREAVPWPVVQELLAMAKNALLAKQRAAEVLLQEARQATSLTTAQAQRAEVDSGLLLEEVQALIDRQRQTSQRCCDLGRANALLMAERELLCEQLEVSADNPNLCQAVQKVLGVARRAKGLEAQLRLLARCQRELLLQLEATREEGASAARHWQACEQRYLQALVAHGVPSPQLPPAPSAALLSRCGPVADAPPCAGPGPGGSGGTAAAGTNMAVYAQALQRLGSGAGLGSCAEASATSPVGSHAQLLPPTPPASDVPPLAGAAALQRMGSHHHHHHHHRRSHSLDSGLCSLTGLLDQLALTGSLTDDAPDLDFEDYDESVGRGSGSSWTLVDEEQQHGRSPRRSDGSGGGGGGSCGGHPHLQPVAECAEEGTELQLVGLGAP